MLQCEISEELMDRVKNFERKLMNAEYLKYSFEWKHCEFLWKDKDTCYNVGHFEIKDSDVSIVLKIFEDGHLYLEASGKENGWIFKEDEMEKLLTVLWLCDNFYFSSPGIEWKEHSKKEMYLNFSYCTARILDDYCDAFDFASFTEETMKEFMMEAATINSELLSYADEKGPF